MSIKQAGSFMRTKHLYKISLAIIIPVFNEEEGIRQTIIDVYQDAGLDSIKALLGSVEVIVVDDGSFDNTPQILKDLTDQYKNFRVIRHKSNQGLGASIATGVKHATKKFVTYLPADGQVFLRDIAEGLKAASSADLVLTYRGRKDDYKRYRRLLSNSLKIFMKTLFGLNFKDYNWVHIYKRDLFKSVTVKSKGVFFLAEIVARTNQNKFKILEVPANYYPRSKGISKNARPTIIVRTLIDLLKLWMELKFRV